MELDALLTTLKEKVSEVASKIDEYNAGFAGSLLNIVWGLMCTDLRPLELPSIQQARGGEFLEYLSNEFVFMGNYLSSIDEHYARNFLLAVKEDLFDMQKQVPTLESILVNNSLPSETKLLLPFRNFRCIAENIPDNLRMTTGVSIALTEAFFGNQYFELIGLSADQLYHLRQQKLFHDMINICSHQWYYALSGAVYTCRPLPNFRAAWNDVISLFKFYDTCVLWPSKENKQAVINTLAEKKLSGSRLHLLSKLLAVRNVDELLQCFECPALPNYLLYRVVGEGKTSKVFAAFNDLDDTHVAIKAIKQTVPEEHRKQFGVPNSRELVHENLCRYYQAQESGPLTDQQLLIIMELFSTSLRKIFEDPESILSPLKVKHIHKQILEALKFCHQKGVMHPDLTPSNVGLNMSSFYKVKLTDFNPAPYTMTMQPKTGPLDYLSPAAILATENHNNYVLTPAENHWAAGCILYEMCTRHKPFSPLAGTIDRYDNRGEYKKAILIKQKERTTDSGIEQMVHECVESLKKRERYFSFVWNDFGSWLKQEFTRLFDLSYILQDEKKNWIYTKKMSKYKQE